MKHRLLIALELVLSKQGGDEIPVGFVHDEIRKQRYCGAVTEADLLELLEELTDQGLYEAMVGDDGKITGSSLIWKSSEHPSLDDPSSNPILL